MAESSNRPAAYGHVVMRHQVAVRPDPDHGGYMAEVEGTELDAFTAPTADEAFAALRGFLGARWRAGTEEGPIDRAGRLAARVEELEDLIGDVVEGDTARNLALPRGLRVRLVDAYNASARVPRQGLASSSESESAPGLDAAYRNVERAARELDALFDGDPDGWRLGGRLIVNTAVSGALLSLHDYLNDVTNAVGVPAGDRRCSRLLVGQGDDTYDPECALPLGHSGPCSPTEARDAG